MPSSWCLLSHPGRTGNQTRGSCNCRKRSLRRNRCEHGGVFTAESQTDVHIPILWTKEAHGDGNIDGEHFQSTTGFGPGIITPPPKPGLPSSASSGVEEMRRGPTHPALSYSRSRGGLQLSANHLILLGCSDAPSSKLFEV